MPGEVVEASHPSARDPQTPMTSPSASTLTMRHTSTAGSPATGAGARSSRSSMVPRSATGTSSWAVAGRNPRAVWRTTTRRTSSRRTVRTGGVARSRSFGEPDAVPRPVRVDAAGRAGVGGGRDEEVAQPCILAGPGCLEGQRVDRRREVVGRDARPVLPPRRGVRRGPGGRARAITGEDPVGRRREDDERARTRTRAAPRSSEGTPIRARRRPARRHAASATTTQATATTAPPRKTRETAVPTAYAGPSATTAATAIRASGATIAPARSPVAR